MKHSKKNFTLRKLIKNLIIIFIITTININASNSIARGIYYELNDFILVKSNSIESIGKIPESINFSSYYEIRNIIPNLSIFRLNDEYCSILYCTTILNYKGKNTFIKAGSSIFISDSLGENGSIKIYICEAMIKNCIGVSAHEDHIVLSRG